MSRLPIFNKKVIAWAFYDWANSAFALSVLAVLFPLVLGNYWSAGDDGAWGGVGDDIIRGGHGGDTIRGDQGNDVLYGGWGDDNVGGHSGDHTIYGKPGPR